MAELPTYLRVRFVFVCVNMHMCVYLHLHIHIHTHGASLVAQLVKNLPTMWETWVQSLVWEDPLEEGVATLSSIFAWKIPMEREARQATVNGAIKSQT